MHHKQLIDLNIKETTKELTNMTTEANTINCYTKLLPKWTALIVLAFGITVAFFLPATSLVFYLLLGMCALFIIKTLSQKPETRPVLVLGESGIQLSESEFYPYKEIEKVLAFSEKRLRFRSVSFKLLLKQGKQVVFCVDNLNTKPQFLLDTINSRIKK